MIFASNTRTDSIGVQEFSQTDLPQTTIRPSSTATAGKVIALLIVLVGGYLGYEMILQEKKLADIVAPLIGKNQDNFAVSIATEIDKALAPILGSNTSNTTVLPLETPPTPATPPTNTQPEVAARPETSIAPDPSIAQPVITEPAGLPPDAIQSQLAQAIPSSSPYPNPYQNLSNGVDSEILPTGRVISAQEEEIWRSGLSHRFVYQRHKTVEDIINERLSGSEALLEIALLSKKFWTRIAALIGLVNLGAFVSPELVELAIADARKSLVANYFKRFLQDNTSYERYVLRYSLRFVNPKARLTILTALLNNQDQWTREYLNAALNDPDPKITIWANNNIHRLDELVPAVEAAGEEVIEEQEGQTVIDGSLPIDGSS